MKTGSGITRRRFLIALTGAGGALLLSAAGIQIWRNTGTRKLEHALGLASLSQWRAVGEKYLKRFPDEADAAVLVDGIFGASEVSLHKHGSEVGEFLRSRVKEDFEKGSVVLIDGWILSRTEGRLAALATITIP